MFILHFLAASHMASQACQRVRSEDDRAAWELFLTTPCGARGTLGAYHRAFCQLFLPQFLMLVVLHAGLLVGALGQRELLGSREVAVVPAAALMVLFAERFGCSWVGMNLSLRHGKYYRALGGVLFWVFFPVWGTVLALLLLSAMGTVPAGFRCWCWLVWLVPGALLPLAAGAWHRRRAARWLRDHGSELN